MAAAAAAVGTRALPRAALLLHMAPAVGLLINDFMTMDLRAVAKAAQMVMCVLVTKDLLDGSALCTPRVSAYSHGVGAVRSGAN